MSDWPPGVPRPNVSDLTYERLDGEVIAVNLATGHYFSMSGPAADVWWLVDQGLHPREWRPILEAAYGTERIGEDELVTFVQTCVEMGLVEFRSDSPPDPDVVLPADMERNAWSAPILEAFSDLQDLILVDPVHDTSELGWPNVEPENE